MSWYESENKSECDVNMMWKQMTSKRASMILNEGSFSELVHGEFLFVFEDSACLS